MLQTLGRQAAPAGQEVALYVDAAGSVFVVAYHADGSLASDVRRVAPRELPGLIEGMRTSGDAFRAMAPAYRHAVRTN